LSYLTSLCADAIAADGEAKVIRTFLLQPHVARVVVRQFHDERAGVLGQLLGDLLDKLLLTLDVNGREELVFVNRLQEILVLLLALIFSIGETMERGAACRRVLSFAAQRSASSSSSSRSRHALMVMLKRPMAMPMPNVPCSGYEERFLFKEFSRAFGGFAHQEAHLRMCLARGLV
jgi:hypothetical protein